MSSDHTLTGTPHDKNLAWSQVPDRNAYATTSTLYGANSYSLASMPESYENTAINFVYGSVPSTSNPEPAELYTSTPYVEFCNSLAPHDPLLMQPPRPSFASLDSEEFYDPKYTTSFGQMTPQSIDLSVSDTTNIAPDPVCSLLSYNMDMSRRSVPALPGANSRLGYNSPESEHNYTRRATEPILSPLCARLPSTDDLVDAEMYHCPVCTKHFPKRHSLKLHMKSHSTEKPFKCSKCPKTFARCHDMKRHEQLHKGIKVYRCHGFLRDGVTKWGCGKKFARSDALTRHLRAGAGWRCLKPLIDETKALDGDAIIDYARKTVQHSAETTTTDSFDPQVQMQIPNPLYLNDFSEPNYYR